MTTLAIETAGDGGDTAHEQEGRGDTGGPGRASAAAGATAAGTGTGTPATALTVTADGSYAARLTRRAEDAWCPERWTLAGSDAYAVALPLDQPEEADSGLLPLSDGRVLIHRRVDGRHLFSLLYPTGPSPSTGQLPLGAVESEHLELLPPAPRGERAYALAVGERSTTVWQVAGGAFGPERVAEVAGRCESGVWLDGTGRMLALNRSPADGGPVKAVALDLERGGEVSPLLQIADGSDDRLLLADPGSGLLLIDSDAPGRRLLGWGVLGSTRPVRFPECLRPQGVVMAPFAVQPGQVLTPEGCAVAFRITAAGGGPGWIGLWRPADRTLRQSAAPEGWLAGAGRWTRQGELHLPYATPGTPCGIATLRMPDPDPESGGCPGTPEPSGPSGPTGSPGPAGPSGSVADGEPFGGGTAGGSTAGAGASAAPRPVPLHQAARSGRITPR